MRVDAKALLDRLGKSDFTYREFADRFSELELWPLFEALLRDERLAQLDGAVDPAVGTADPAVGAAAAGTGAARGQAGDGAPHPAAHQPSAHQPFAALFSRYEAGQSPAGRGPGAPPTPSELPPQDVRMLLRQLAELQRKGEL